MPGWSRTAESITRQGEIVGRVVPGVDGADHLERQASMTVTVLELSLAT
jgi:hypothetical protein